MKSRLLLLSALTLTLPALGCRSDELLDIVSPTQVADDNFWTQENDAVLFLNGTYSQLPSVNTVIDMDAFTDNATTNRQFDVRYFYGDGSFDAQTSYGRDRWNGYYGAVARTNMLLANIDRIPTNLIDATRKARYIAEAKFLRGVFYLELVSLFGDVPMPLKPVSDEEARALTNTPATQVYDQVIKDFDEAIAVLPLSYTGGDIGRATKGAAMAYKARAALRAGRFEIARASAKAVMDLNLYKLHPDYASLFTYAGENSTEVIFSRRYSKTAQAPGQTSNAFQEYGPASNSANARIVPIRQLVDAYQMSNGQPITTSPTYNPAPYPSAGGTMHDNRDPRLAATILFPGATWDGRTFDSRPKGVSTQSEAIDLQNENTSVTGYYLRKWIDLTDKGDRGNGGIDIILMRYADVLLMFAEAKVALGQADAEALGALNQVRVRAGMPALTAIDQAAVRYERRVELAFEGLRLFDIRRWGIGPQVMVVPAVTGIDYLNAAGAKVTVAVPVSARAFPARSALWPIPQSEIDLNANLKQNPGY